MWTSSKPLGFVKIKGQTTFMRVVNNKFLHIISCHKEKDLYFTPPIDKNFPVTHDMNCIGAIHTEFITKKGTSGEWHYYISSRELTAEQLLRHARMEWSVESMHRLLDVHFEEDQCRVESKDVQQCLNMFRKAAINLIKNIKLRNNSKTAISNIMFECLMDRQSI